MGGTRDGRAVWGPGLMRAARYAGQAGGTHQVARSLNFAFRAVRACVLPPWNNDKNNNKENFGHLGPRGRSSPSPSL